jgi:hypothetical protein
LIKRPRERKGLLTGKEILDKLEVIVAAKRRKLINAGSFVAWFFFYCLSDWWGYGGAKRNEK